MGALVTPAGPGALLQLSQFDLGLQASVIAGFTLLCLLQIGTARFRHALWMQSLYVHASQGFYLDLPARRLVNRLWRQ
jgi:hypothetical protein